MIVPIRCFTCGKPIDNEKWHEYLDMISEEKREETIARLIETTVRPFGQKNELEDKDVTPEYVALNLLGIRKMCCRRMYLGTIDMFEKL